MTPIDAAAITSWHAHVYFDAATRDEAWQLREEIASRFGDSGGEDSRGTRAARAQTTGATRQIRESLVWTGDAI